MTRTDTATPGQLKGNRITTVILSLFCLAVIGRTLVGLSQYPALHPHRVWCLGLEVVFLGLFVSIEWILRDRRSRLLWYFILQSGIVMAIIALAPSLDFLNDFFILLTYQAAVFLSGRMRWAWIAAFIVLSGASSIFSQGLVRGLALGLVPVAVEIVMAAGFITSQEVEAAQSRSRAMVTELQETQKKLSESAIQVEELAAIEERNRLAGELHDSVSQTLFSIQLNIRSAQLLLEKDPVRVRTQLEILRDLAQSALAEMRSLIVQMRIKEE
jgi:signal transduction histidine kinase